MNAGIKKDLFNGEDYKENICTRSIDMTYDEYRKGLAIDDSNESLVINVDNYKYFNACVSWYGIHPKIGLSLGLHCSEDFPPKWVDEDERIRCYSINWKEGSWTHRHYSRDEICSKGWVVLIHKKTFNDILEKFDLPLSYGIKFSRESYDYRQSQFDSTHSKRIQTWKQCL